MVSSTHSATVVDGNDHHHEDAPMPGEDLTNAKWPDKIQILAKVKRKSIAIFLSGVLLSAIVFLPIAGVFTGGAIKVLFWLTALLFIAMYVSIAIALTAVIWRDLKEKAPDRRLSTPIIVTLIGAVLVQGAAIAIGFGRLAQGFFRFELDRYRITRNELPSLFPKHTVLATDSIDDKSRPADCIPLPPHHALQFVSGTTTRWAFDPLDGLEGVVQHLPFSFPWRTMPISEAKIMLGKQLDLAIVDIRSSYPTAQAASVEDDRIATMRVYVKELQSSLDEPVNKGHVVIDLATLKTSDIKKYKAAVAFWKRVLGNAFGNRGELEDSRVLGPYYGPEGAEFLATRDSYPLRGGHSAEVVAFIGTFDKTGVFVRENPVSFSRFNDSISNSTDHLVYVRLVMNDERPKDNGSGYCTIRYRVIPLE